MKIEDTLLDLLACPVCKGTLRPVAGEGDASVKELCCDACRRAYPIHDGIPDLLPASGRSLDEDA